MLLTWQAFVLQDHVKDLPLTEQKRQFLAHQLEYDNMMRQKLILENANASSNASGAGGGGGGTFVGDLIIQLFCRENYGDGWAGTGGSKAQLNIIHPTKGIINFGFDALNDGLVPPWARADLLSTEKLPGITVRDNKEVLSITIIERNIPYPTQQYGTNLITQNAYANENTLSVMAGWSPYPNKNRYPRMNVVSIRGSFADNTNYPAPIWRGGIMLTNQTYNDMFTIPKFDGGSTGTLDYSSPVNSYLRNFKNI